MPAWLFQSIDPRRIDAIRAGHVERWCVRRYRLEMQPSDVVFIWRGGVPAVRGIHGCGRLVSAPYTDAADRAFHVDIRYEQHATPFLPAVALREHPILHTLSILHMPRATNFRLRDEQAVALADLLGSATRP